MEEAPEIAGLTLRQFAQRCGASERAVRDRYRAALRTPGALTLPRVTRRVASGGTIKLQLAVPGVGGGLPLAIESVLIPMRDQHGAEWTTLCVSSQVGCRMGCTFCETGQLGLLRNLSAAEIVAQYLVARDLLAATRPMPEGQWRYAHAGIHDIVFMGMGEPLDNLDAVVQAIRVLGEPNGLNFPRAQITISTVGRIDGLRRLAALGWPTLRLAVSLVTADEALRRELLPITRAMPLPALREALLAYPFARKAVLMVEVALLRGVNDSPGHARQVAAWCDGLRCAVNLIPYNPQRVARYAPPDEPTVAAFAAELRRHGVFVTRRRPKGRDLLGACGQLGAGPAAV